MIPICKLCVRIWGVLSFCSHQVNYFGRVSDIEKIGLAPVLIRKGHTKLALYGLGHVRDERLARSFELKQVTVARPVVDPEGWFSVMVLHQNRHPRGAGPVMKGYIKDGILPSCMDLVIWGHEHECQARVTRTKCVALVSNVSEGPPDDSRAFSHCSTYNRQCLSPRCNQALTSLITTLQLRLRVG